METIARFGRRIEIQPGLWPTYSDCSADELAPTDLLGFLGRYYGWGSREWERAGAAASRRRQVNLFEFGLFGMTPEPASQAKIASTEFTDIRENLPDGRTPTRIAITLTKPVATARITTVIYPADDGGE